ncbi:type IV secretion system protein [Yoonia vestfoldensis]|uniref:TrbL/VirB6 plasmid conjugal transfer protein n=1 Tax=Yoonia vestfoldensis TaxID=245188 RepID=A0A1Y0E6V9_9RHOB|nr:type IV secretion system protein [Yoonia vestfoldensis]ART99354.1 TrbL/VirB6 plasmid conjugal transfer protein [Yoonia vestfoldensis]
MNTFCANRLIPTPLWTIVAVCFLIVFATVGPAMAQGTVAADGIVDNMAIQFENMGARLADVVIGIAVMLFAVDIVFTFGRAIMSGSGFGDVTSRFVMRLGFVIIVLGFARTIDDIVPALINAALNIGRIASGSEAAPDPSVGGIMMTGIEYGARMLDEISIWEPLSVLYVIVALIVVCVAAIVAGVLVLVYMEFYVVAFGGMIVLGFGGLTGTKEIAVVYMKSVLGQALKLIGFLITFSIMQEITLSVLSSDSNFSAMSALLAIALQIILLVLITTIPSAMMGLAGGISAGSASEMAGKIAGQAAVTAVAAGTGAAIGAGVGAAVGSASAAAGSMGGPLTQTAGSMISGAGSGAMSGTKKGASMVARAIGETSRPGVGRHTAKVIERALRSKDND